MTDLVLHHYPNRLLREGARSVRHQAACVEVGADPGDHAQARLMPLTGGYRKTPVAGRRRYLLRHSSSCSRWKRAPRPPLLPVDKAGEARALAMWIDRTHLLVGGRCRHGRIGDLASGGLSQGSQRIFRPTLRCLRLKAAVPFTRDQTYAQMVLAEEMLADGTALPAVRRRTSPTALYNQCGSSKERLGAGRRCRRSIACRASSRGRNA